MYSQFTDLKRDIVDELKKVSFVAITCDMWSSRANESYLTVSCHFINEDFELKYYVLSTKPLMNNLNKNADNVSNSIQTIFKEYDIEEKIVCIVSDNDATMKKMCSNLKKRNLPCLAHSINLLVQDALMLPNIHILIQKCKRIVRFFKASNIATEKLKLKQNENNPLKLIQEVPTRWNSCLAMIKRIVQLKDSINSCLLDIEKSPEPFRSEEVLLLTELEKILEPFEEATKKVSSSKCVTVSLINPIICGLFMTMNETKKNVSNNEAKQVIEFILSKMTERLYPYESRSITRIGTILDPRFKKEGFRVESNAEEAIKYLESEITLTSIFQNRNLQTELSSSPPKDSISSSSLFSFMTQRLEKKQRSVNVDAIIVKRQYLEQQNCDPNMDPLLYWKVCD